MPAKHPAPAFRHPAVTLRMADGGEVSPWSLKGMANTIRKATTKSPEDIERDRMRAEYIARNAPKPAAPAPAAAPSPIMTAAPMGSTSVLQRREAAAGLRNGGEVPGEGEGDKIPAMYEPGEFVVSNDMLDAAPSLRGDLRSLREGVLAQKGMTPEEADAKAMGGATLRAVQGFGGEDEQNLQRVSVPQPAYQAGAGVRSGAPAAGGSDAGWLQSSVQSLKTKFPDTAAVISGTADDVSESLRGGSYLKGAIQAGRGAAAALPAAWMDTTGAAIKNVLPAAEDSARTLFSMEPRQPAQPYAQAPKPPQTPVQPAPVAPNSIAQPNVLGQTGRDIGDTGAMRFDVAGKSPLYTDKASLRSSEQMLTRPVMGENDPGMMGIQARQDSRMNSLRQQAQYDQEVAAANEINARYKPREGVNRMQARLQSEASLRNDATTRRGQDMELSGREFTAGANARLARAQGARDQANKDREFDAGRGDKAFEKNAAAKKAVDDQIDNRFIDPVTNKPNLQKSAEFKSFLENGLADELSRLKESKDPRAKALAANLSYDKMDADDLSAMYELFANRDAAMKNKGSFMPGSSDFVESLRPKDWVASGVNLRTFGGDRVKYAGGSQVSVNDLTGASFGNMYSKSNANFDRTLRNAEEAQRRQGQ